MNASASSARPVAILSVLGAVVIWGSTFVVTKTALAEFGPMGLAFLRFLIASAVLVPLAWRSLASAKPSTKPPVTPLAKPSINRFEARWYDLPWRTFFIMALTGVVLYFLLQNIGLSYASATAASVISASVPALTAAVSWLLLKERLGRTQVVGILVSIVGVASLVLSESGKDHGGSMVGNLLLLASMLSWAFYTLAGRRVASAAPNTVVTGAVLGIGTVLLLPFAAYEWATGGFPAPSMSGIMSLVFLGLGGSGASFLLWNRGLQHLKAGEATAFINLIPLVGVLTAAVFLDETVRWIHLVSGATVLLGVYLASQSAQASGKAGRERSASGGPSIAES